MSLLRRYPIASFFILATALGGGVIYLVVAGVLPTGLALIAAVSASVAGIIMTAIEDGKAGLKLMLQRLFIWRVGIGYWAFAMLFLPVVIILGSLANPLFGGDAMEFSQVTRPLQIIPIFVIFFIVAGLGEELGWTGFLLPRLQARHGALTSSIIRAILIGIWHLPLLLLAASDPSSLPDFPYGEWIAQKGFVLTLGVFIALILLPWSIFITWMFNNTKGSLLLVVFLHTSEVWVAYWMLNTGIDPRNINNFLGYGIVLAVVAFIIVFANGTINLSRKLERIVHSPAPRSKENALS